MRFLVSVFALLFSISFANGQSSFTLARAMENPDRPTQDKERDSSRRAPEVLQFMGVERGDTALDVIAMGGWYTEVLSYAVGDSGKVYMHNNPIPITERSTDERAERSSRLNNIEDYIGSIAELPANSIDYAMTALNFHDVYNRSAADANSFLLGIKSVLKPGGVLGIIDHKGAYGADNSTLHRIAFEDLVKAVLDAGFTLVAVNDLLANPEDDHTLAPFDPILERRTDRLLLKFQKPM